MEEFLHQTGWWLGHIGALILCLIGIAVSLFSFTGSWFVAVAAGLLLWCRDDGAVSWVFIAALIVANILVELFDFFAGSVGIARRGGSTAAGWAALIGGLGGMVLGAFIPVPVLGILFGMCAGSFLCAFAVERQRLRHDQQAAHIAWGAVWARLGVTLVKVSAALGMTGVLWYVVLS